MIETTTGPLEHMRIVSKSGNQWLLERGIFGDDGVTTPSTPIVFKMSCGVFYTAGGHYTGSLDKWDFANDPHGLNASGTTLTSIYPGGHGVFDPSATISDIVWF